MMFQTLVILAQAAPGGAPTPPQPSPIASLMPLLFIGVIFYFLLIRPQQKRAKEQAAMVAALKTGDQVVTSAGIHGLVANVKDKTLTLKIADNVKIEMDRDAVARVLKKAEA